MAEPIVTKQECGQLMKLEGELKGVMLKNIATFLTKEEGEKALGKVEKVVSDLGHPLRYNDIKGSRLYPVGLMALSLLVVQRVFGYSDKKFYEMGRFSIRLPADFFRALLVNLVSVKRLASSAPFAWRRHYTTGDMEIGEMSEGEKYITFRLKNFDSHPLLCQLHAGFLAGLLGMVIGEGVPSCEEVRCSEKGSDYHEFIVRWGK
jgi:hypothetical protein